jgi:ethanolamine utilization protein EutN
MILCRVVGNAVSTIKQECYTGWRVMVCVPVQPDGKTARGHEFLSVDSVQAGPGDLVLVAREGNAARQVLGKASDPFHSVIMGIVDEVYAPIDRGPGGGA